MGNLPHSNYRKSR